MGAVLAGTFGQSLTSPPHLTDVHDRLHDETIAWGLTMQDSLLQRRKPSIRELRAWLLGLELLIRWGSLTGKGEVPPA